MSARYRQVVAGPIRNVALTSCGLLASLLACGPESKPPAPVKPGIEVLAADSLDILAGLRVGLITNHTGVARDGRPSANVLLEAGIDVVALLAPEHGLSGSARPGETIEDTTDEASGLPVYSLYGDRLAPDSAILVDLDALVFDIQDVGARYYTYVSTMAEAMRAAASAGLTFVVADRPNPIGGELVQGNVLDPSFASFVGLFPVAMRHGMTVGELALMFNEEFSIGARLHVIPMQGWRRSEWADDTGLPWIPTSPNMPSLESASHYPGTCLFEGTNLSVGRGTERPFQVIGATWLEPDDVLTRLSDGDLAGVRLTPTRFTPRGAGDSKYEGVSIPGIRLEVTDRRRYDPTRTALALLVAIRETADTAWGWRPAAFDRLAGTDRLRIALEEGRDVHGIVNEWAGGLAAFRMVRARHLIYP
ncbi:MAG: DUF1343 domain-containing protein [Gemmatimonadetes bacterium]|nr:DUF1343 domain-containing protein [Gemmatimonadota bacterium]MBT8478577.1 DUF1343 domain-containing protein [Gemmatimonadota bacterium]